MVVIAILGILGAITVPVVSSYVGSAKERAYEADLQKIQVAVSAYYSSPSNVRFAGKRQYPNFGRVNQGTANALLKANASSTELTTVGTGLSSNPIGGTQGGTPSWEDIDGDGVRTEGAEKLFYYAATTTPSVDHWNTTEVTRGNQVYVVDSRDWLIDFDELVAAQILNEVPAPASKDHGAGLDGSYTWYIDENGKVNSLSYFFPETSTTAFQDSYP